jgi:hypothetical protein
VTLSLTTNAAGIRRQAGRGADGCRAVQMPDKLWELVEPLLPVKERRFATRVASDDGDGAGSRLHTKHMCSDRAASMSIPPPGSRPLHPSSGAGDLHLSARMRLLTARGFGDMWTVCARRHRRLLALAFLLIVRACLVTGRRRQRALRDCATRGAVLCRRAS